MKRLTPSVAPFLALVVLLWLPFGVHMGPVLEEWGVLGLYTSNGPFLFAGADSLMPMHQMRPIMTALWGLGYMVDPNSWWFWHLELAAILLIKGVSMSSIVMYLTGSRRWAVVAGLLFIVWPADTLQMAFRAMPITLAVALTVTSAALLIAAMRAPAPGRQLALAAGASICLLAGAWTYELTLAYWPLPFLLIWAREGWSGMLTTARRAWGAVAVWTATAAVCVAYIAWTLLTAKVLYQKDVAMDRHHLITTLVEHLPMLFSMGLLRALVTGWVDAVRIAAHDFSTHWYFVVVAVVVAALLMVYRQRQVVRGRVLLKTAIIGLGGTMLGYAPYIIGHLNSSDRTFIFAAFGATLVFLATLGVVDRLSPKAAMVAAVILVTFGTAQQLWQFREYAALFERQRYLLKAMVEQVPVLKAGQTMIILDGSEQLNDTYMLNDVIPSALTYLYGAPVPPQNVQVCFPGSGIWAIRDAALQQGACEETPDGWVFRYPLPVKAIADKTPVKPDLQVPIEKAVVVKIGPDGKSAAPGVGGNQGSGHLEVLQDDAWPLAFLEQQPGNSYRWDFGRRWTMQDVNRGSGWMFPEWNYELWRPFSTVWMNKPRATLLFQLGQPSAEPYQLSAHLTAIAGVAPETLKARINEVDVPVQWTGPLDFTASVPKALLRSGSNLLEFQTPPSTDSWGVSMHFDWITLAPVTTK